MTQKLRIGLIFGGKTGEHEISLLSAQSIAQALDRTKYEVVLLGIDKTGQWHLGQPANFLLSGQNPAESHLNLAASEIVTAQAGDRQITLISQANPTAQHGIDVAFPIIHGISGEDGALQGFLETLGVPYVGAGVLGSAIGMDKDVMKRLLRNAGLLIPNFRVFADYQRDQISYEELTGQLGTPLFIKPANTGSSVGISKVTSENEFDQAITEAFLYDRKIMIEEAIVGREIECSVLGNDQPRASLPGEIKPKDEFYTYKAKYFDGFLDVEIPAKLTEDQTQAIQELAIKTYQTLNCQGMARVDFFLKQDGTVLINELNTLPGFTSTSMYPKLWAASGLSYPELLDELIQLAIERHNKKSQLVRTYQLPQ